MTNEVHGSPPRTPAELAHHMAYLARRMWRTILDVGPYQPQPEPAQAAAWQRTRTPAEIADMYAQTIVYGLFAEQLTGTTMAPEITSTISQYGRLLAPLIAECRHLLDSTDLDAVLRDFGKASGQDDPLLHFYETFLHAYAPHQREVRGVYYTPAPVVAYVVSSLHTLLRAHFGRSQGLADETTLLFDPAAGTATFLHAAVQHIHTTLREQGMSAAAWHQYVSSALLPRLAGCEVLMAPYTIAHLKLHLLLEQSGYHCAPHERINIALCNTLTEAETPPLTPGYLPVILGNPPYATTTANRGAWEQQIRQHYYPRDAIREQNPKLLLDDYVKFIRFAQWHIAQAGQGVVAFVTNHSYLDNPTFRTMRQSLLATFSELYLLNMHGNARQKEQAPDGTPDQNVFDIQQGVAVGIFVKRPAATDASTDTPARVHYADLWGLRSGGEGGGKYAWLATHDVTTTPWQTLEPAPPFSLLVPFDTALWPEYQRGWSVTEIFPLYATGIKTHRDHFVFDTDRAALVQRIADFRNLALDDETIRQRYRLPDTRDWLLPRRRRLLSETPHWQDHLVRCLYRPFDTRYLYYHRDLVERSLTRVMRHLLAGDNYALLTVRQVAERQFSHVFATDTVAECRSMLSNRGAGYVFPLYCLPDEDARPGSRPRPNLSPAFLAHVESRLTMRFVPHGHGDLRETVGPLDLFHYLYALLHSTAYRQRYAAFLRIDFPRVPFTGDRALFADLAAQGAALLRLHTLQGGAALATAADTAAPFEGAGNNRVAWVRYTAAPGGTAGTIAINQTQYFAGVEPAVWEMQIGGYAPLQKWLKGRRHTTLSGEDIRHYQRMVAALRETRRHIEAIDARIPGWPLP